MDEAKTKDGMTYSQWQDAMIVAQRNLLNAINNQFVAAQHVEQLERIRPAKSEDAAAEPKTK